MSEKTFRNDADTTSHAIFIVAAASMVAIGIYMTTHYFNVRWPDGLSAGHGLCDINSFLNCDGATMSKFSNILGVPIALLGLMLGVFMFSSYAVNHPGVDRTNHFLLLVNAVLCGLLLLISIFVLGSLCPFCTLYYIASLAALWVYRKNSSSGLPDWRVLGIYTILVLGASGLTWSNVQKKQNRLSDRAKGLIEQFNALKKYPPTEFESDYRMASATKKFTDAPIQITKFSDFQCPACKALGEELNKVGKKYDGKINIQYFFYPLDNACHTEMKRSFHAFACKAAYLAACLPDRFKEIEHDIFAHQSELSLEWINKTAEKYGVKDCIAKPETKEKVQKYIAAAKPYGVKSTPTFLLNGVKIEGVLNADDISILVDYVLNKK